MAEAKAGSTSRGVREVPTGGRRRQHFVLEIRSQPAEAALLTDDEVQAGRGSTNSGVMFQQPVVLVAENKGLPLGSIAQQRPHL